MPDRTTRKARHEAKRASGEWKAKRSEDRPEPVGRTGGTRYVGKKRQWAIAAQTMARHGDPPRLIAKRLGVSLSEVKDVIGA